MAKFDKKEFGERLKQFRNAKGLTLENIGKCINKDATTVGRYERGEILPDIESVSKICEELEIYESDLFGTRLLVSNNENSKNPFGTKELFLYYIAYFPSKKKFGKGKFKIIINEKSDTCEACLVDYKTEKIYLKGQMLADGNIAVFILENYKPNSIRLEVSEIILNISSGIDGLMAGTYHCTNAKYVPSIRRCYATKTDLEFDDKMLERLKITDEEFEDLKENDVLYINLYNIQDFED